MITLEQLYELNDINNGIEIVRNDITISFSYDTPQRKFCLHLDNEGFVRIHTDYIIENGNINDNTKNTGNIEGYNINHLQVQYYFSKQLFPLLEANEYISPLELMQYKDLAKRFMERMFKEKKMIETSIFSRLDMQTDEFIEDILKESDTEDIEKSFKSLYRYLIIKFIEEDKRSNHIFNAFVDKCHGDVKNMTCILSEEEPITLTVLDSNEGSIMRILDFECNDRIKDIINKYIKKDILIDNFVEKFDNNQEER